MVTPSTLLRASMRHRSSGGGSITPLVSAAVGTGTGSAVVSKPASGWNVGNLLLAFVTCGTTTVPTLPSGWTSITTVVASTHQGSLLCWRTLSSAAPASYTFSGASANMSAIILEYDGRVAAGIDQFSTSSGTATTISWTSITNTSANEIVVAFAGNYAKGTFGTPTGFTLEASYNPSTTFHGCSLAFDAQQTAAGSTGSLTATAPASNNWTSILVSLVP